MESVMQLLIFYHQIIYFQFSTLMLIITDQIHNLSQSKYRQLIISIQMTIFN